jgi:hypothetical protein
LGILTDSHVSLFDSCGEAWLYVRCPFVQPLEKNGSREIIVKETVLSFFYLLFPTGLFSSKKVKIKIKEWKGRCQIRSEMSWCLMAHI